LESLEQEGSSIKIYNRSNVATFRWIYVYENTNSGSCYVMAIPIIQNWNSKG
jgi:hypothetical protein